MLDIKLLAVDLDETFLDQDAKVSEQNRIAVCKAVEQGIIFVVASGRMRYRMPDDVLSIPGLRYLVTSNGANVLDLQTGRVLFEDPISDDIALNIVCSIRQYPIYLELYSGGYAVTDRQLLSYYSPEMYSPGRRTVMERGIHIADDLQAFIADPQNVIDKINIPIIPAEYSKEVSEILTRPEICITQSLPQNAEVNHCTANKAEGLSFLCNKLGIRPEQVLAFGDADNDLEMLQFAGHSVAMGNASSEAKAYSRYVTKSNTENGVAWFLEKYVLRQIS